jgi:predicted DCC family thiol-disulfide oxidoreductase YuxK
MVHEKLAHNHEKLSTVIYWDTKKLHTKSSASLHIAKDMRNWISIFYILIIIPPIIRNGIYDYIAKNRTRWFGKTDTCMINHSRLLT